MTHPDTPPADTPPTGGRTNPLAVLATARLLANLPARYRRDPPARPADAADAADGAGTLADETSATGGVPRPTARTEGQA